MFIDLSVSFTRGGTGAPRLSVFAIPVYFPTNPRNLQWFPGAFCLDFMIFHHAARGAGKVSPPSCPNPLSFCEDNAFSRDFFLDRSAPGYYTLNERTSASESEAYWSFFRVKGELIYEQIYQGRHHSPGRRGRHRLYPHAIYRHVRSGQERGHHPLPDPKGRQQPDLHRRQLHRRLYPHPRVRPVPLSRPGHLHRPLLV